MPRKPFILRMPNELLYLICTYLSLADLDALENSYRGRVNVVVRSYIFAHGIASTRYPLHELVRIKRLDCIEYLASQTGDARSEAVHVNVSDPQGRTALHIAAENGAVPVVRALLRFPNVDKQAKDRYGQTPVVVAIWNRRLPVIELLLREGAEHPMALRLAVQIGFEELAALLVGMDGEDVNEADACNWSPLMVAIRYGRTAIARMLLSRADIDTESRERRSHCTALLMAASLGQVSTLAQLLDRGANAHASDRDERTALSLAVEGGHSMAVKVLLAQGIDPRRVDRRGRTCLHYAAAQRGSERTLEMLLARGCDPRLHDNAGMTPIALAVKAQHNVMVSIMLQATPAVDYGALLVAAAEYNNMWAAGRALAHVDPNVVHRGTTPLLLAAKPAFVRVMLADKRVDPNQCDHTGRTPLIHAVRHNWVSVVRTLLARSDLNVDLVDNNNQSASDYAVSLGLKNIDRLLRVYRQARRQRKHRSSAVARSAEGSQLTFRSKHNHPNRLTRLRS